MDCGVPPSIAERFEECRFSVVTVHLFAVAPCDWSQNGAHGFPPGWILTPLTTKIERKHMIPKIRKCEFDE